MVYLIIIAIILFIYFLHHPKTKIYALKLKRNALSLIIMGIMIGIVSYAKSTIQISQKSMLLWVNNVVPSLFSFLICLELIKETNVLPKISHLLTPFMKPLFGVSGSAGTALLLGLISGYPIGAKVTKDQYEKGICTKEEAEKMLTFVNNSGPLFIVGAVGVGMFYDEKIGILLFVSHVLASITVGILLKKYHLSPNTSGIISQVSIKSNTPHEIHLKTLGKTMKSSIQNTLSTLVMILGYMVFFGTVGNILVHTRIEGMFSSMLEPILHLLNLSSNLTSGLFHGLLEVTSGIASMASEIRIPFLQKLCFTSFLLGFGGLSVHMQVISLMADTKILLKPYLLGKMLQGIIASIYTILFYQLIA